MLLGPATPENVRLAKSIMNAAVKDVFYPALGGACLWLGLWAWNGKYHSVALDGSEMVKEYRGVFFRKEMHVARYTRLYYIYRLFGMTNL